jgi:proprotein convertase subtilisin/kexin type 2
MKTINRSLSLLTLMTALILAACSSGGGGGSAPPPPPAALSGITATANDGYVLLNATAASGVTGVNIYWSATSGVSKITGTKIIVGSAPQAHTGLSNGTPYYYVLTTVSEAVESAESLQVSAMPMAASLPASAPLDPFYDYQWHLKNTAQLGATGVAGTAGEDLNVEPVWTLATPIKGSGVRVAVVDDGLEIGHEDLASNLASNELSINYATGSNDPSNSPSDLSSGHGTAVAGIIAARDSNGKGVRGVAPRANLVGYNYLQNSTLSNLADAMIRGAAAVYVSNNSWGPGGGHGNLSAAPVAWRSAIDIGLSSGRNGKGTIYVFAAGNGAPAANSNYHGYSNSHGIIAVGAVTDRGIKSTYSEEGANLWVSAPGGEFCNTHTITTTDRSGGVGINTSATANVSDYLDQKYTLCMNGTSAATPGVSGVVALMLEARPVLGWRDVKVILAQTARINDPAGGGWFANGGSPLQYGFSHKYGFGVVDASAAVALAKTWPLISGAELVQTSTALPTNIPVQIPDAPAAGVSSTITVASSTITQIEFVEITFSAPNHSYAGDLEVTLTGPASTANPGGTVSRLAETHNCMDTSETPVPAACAIPYDNWVFGSSAHLDETPVGNWTLTVTDKKSGDTGTFQSWGLKFYGR